MNSLKKSDAKTPFGKMLLSLQLAASKLGNKLVMYTNMVTK